MTVSYGRFTETARALDRRWPAIRPTPDLGRMATLMRRLGDPQRSIPAVHITGTNGKTSTARMIDELLRVTGRRTGRYTSPHLETVRERIVVDGEPIPEAGFVATYDVVAAEVESLDRELPTRLSFFEITTAMAFVAFARAGLDAIVVEVGMGGCWDATNVVDGRVAVVTPISLDHAEHLGADVATIAREKAGIIKPGAVAVLAPQPEPARLVLSAHCLRVGADLRDAHAPPGPGEATSRPDGQVMDLAVGSRRVPGLRLPLLGRYQAENARVAAEAADAFLGADETVLTDSRIRRAMSRVRAPGRLERIRDAPPVLVDASHNPGGVAATVGSLGDALCALGVDRLIVVLAVLRDKDAAGIVRALEPVAGTVVVSQVDSPRALPAAALATVATRVLGGRVLVEPRLEDAVRVALDHASRPGTRAAVLVTGNVATAGAARSMLAGPRDRQDE